MRKKLLYALVVFTALTCGTRAFGDIITIVLSSPGETNAPYPSSTNILIAADSVVEWGGVNINVTVGFPESPGSTNFSRTFSINDPNFSDSWNAGGGIRMVAGPARLHIENPGSINASPVYTAFCTLKITKQTGTFTPSTAVVIPSDTQGPVDIVLESSTNLVDWTQALPGTYGSSSQQRYFRVRAIRH